MSKESWRARGAPSSTNPMTSTTGDTVFAERRVRTMFCWHLTNYKDYRRRAKLFLAGRRMEDKAKDILVLLMTGLPGLAWDCFESIDENNLEKYEELGQFFSTMDARFKYDHRVELPNRFEDIFMKCWRPRDMIPLAYVTESERRFRQLEEYKCRPPDDLKGLLMLRRSGISNEHRTMVLGNMGKHLNVESVGPALYSTFGQDSLPDRRFKHGHAFIADDDDPGDDFADVNDYDDACYDAGGEHYESDYPDDYYNGNDQGGDDAGA